MATVRYEVGDEVMVRGTVTATWPDGQVAVQIAADGDNVMVQGDSDLILVGWMPRRRRRLQSSPDGSFIRRQRR